MPITTLDGPIFSPILLLSPLTKIMAQISSASQLPESLEAPRSHRPRLAGPPTSVATTLNGSETTSISVPPQSDLEPGQPGHDAVVDEIPNNSPQEDSWWNTDDPWSRDTVLTLGVWRNDLETDELLIMCADGGGVRGYSSLLILKAIMARVEAHEQRLDSNVECSAHPFQHRKCERIPPAPTRASTLRPNERNAAVAEANPKFLPAHYFNYIGGASTGGYDIPLPKKLPKSQCWDQQTYCYHARPPLNDSGGMLSSIRTTGT